MFEEWDTSEALDEQQRRLFRDLAEAISKEDAERIRAATDGDFISLDAKEMQETEFVGHSVCVPHWQTFAAEYKDVTREQFIEAARRMLFAPPVGDLPEPDHVIENGKIIPTGAKQ